MLRSIDYKQRPEVPSPATTPTSGTRFAPMRMRLASERSGGVEGDACILGYGISVIEMTPEYMIWFEYHH